MLLICAIAGCSKPAPAPDTVDPYYLARTRAMPPDHELKVSQKLYCLQDNGEWTEITTIMGPITCADFGGRGDGLPPTGSVPWDDGKMRTVTP